MMDVLQNLNLHTVFPSLSIADQKAHQTALENLNNEPQIDPNATLYGKDDMLPIDDWRLQKMSPNKTLTYMQTVKMTELVLRDFRTWIYKHYGWYMTMLQICIIMLWWGVAQTADDSFFLMRWIQAWSELFEFS